MTRVADIVGEKEYLSLPRLQQTELKLLWHAGYWDGPIDGMVSYNGSKYWFQMCDDEEYYRRFLLVMLSQEQLEEEKYWHELFRRKVGRHTDYDDQGKRPTGAIKPKELAKEFYEAYKTRRPRDLSNNEVIGWFEW